MPYTSATQPKYNIAYTALVPKRNSTPGAQNPIVYFAFHLLSLLCTSGVCRLPRVMVLTGFAAVKVISAEFDFSHTPMLRWTSKVVLSSYCTFRSMGIGLVPLLVIETVYLFPFCFTCFIARSGTPSLKNQRCQNQLRSLPEPVFMQLKKSTATGVCHATVVGNSVVLL